MMGGWDTARHSKVVDWGTAWQVTMLKDRQGQQVHLLGHSMVGTRAQHGTAWHIMVGDWGTAWWVMMLTDRHGQQVHLLGHSVVGNPGTAWHSIAHHDG
jgi:hypothetical protein